MRILRNALRVSTALTLALLLSPAVIRAQQVVEGEFSFDWDLVSLEQNNFRFNGSVLSGFHSVRSPGVTPHRAKKAGVGILYSHEEQTATVGSQQTSLESDLLTVNPKLNYGLFDIFEFGVGAEATFADGSEVERSTGNKESNDNFNISAAVLGAKWKFLDLNRFRLALAADTRIATRRRQFGMLPGSVFNFEIDGDYAFTSKFTVVSNLQFLTSDRSEVSDQAVFDLASNYSFTEQFRGMLFTTVQEDDEADSVVFFIGFAGQYVHQEHAFTLALDFQLNDARREVRTENQIDVEFSYTITF